MIIRTQDCIGCGQCFEECTVKAISMTSTHGYAQAVINKDLCIDCGACKKICPGECIYDN